MANKYTAQKIDIKKVILLYEKGMSQIEVAKKLKTTQKVIWQRLNKIGYKCRIPKKRNQFGKNNDSWKGNKAGYAALHYRVYTIYGNPKKCDVCNLKDKNRKYHWANLTGKFEDIDDYKRMCISCHRKYDNKRKNNILR